MFGIGELIIVLFVLCCGMLWIYALIDCVQREFDYPPSKIVWVLVVLLANGIGAIVYLIVGRPMGHRP